MSIQSDAILALVTAYHELDPAERTKRHGVLWANPVIAAPHVIAAARAEALGNDETELAAQLEWMIRHDLIVEAVEPQRERARLAALRPGYVNRAARRKGRRPAKPGKTK